MQLMDINKVTQLELLEALSGSHLISLFLFFCQHMVCFQLIYFLKAWDDTYSKWDQTTKQILNFPKSKADDVQVSSFIFSVNLLATSSLFLDWCQEVAGTHFTYVLYFKLFLFCL